MVQYTQHPLSEHYRLHRILRDEEIQN
jgi:hypothetical protein